MTEKAARESRASELRRVFDRAFALPAASTFEELEDLLLVRIAGDPYTIRLRDITGILTKRTIIPVPARAPGLLGLVGIRGEIVPVFGLSSWLGYGEDADSAVWMIVCGTDEPIGFGFSEFEGHLRIPKSVIHTDDNSHGPRQYIHEMATIEAGVRPVIALSQLVATLRNRPGLQRPEKE